MPAGCPGPPAAAGCAPRRLRALPRGSGHVTAVRVSVSVPRPGWRSWMSPGRSGIPRARRCSHGHVHACARPPGVDMLHGRVGPTWLEEHPGMSPVVGGHRGAAEGCTGTRGISHPPRDLLAPLRPGEHTPRRAPPPAFLRTELRPKLTAWVRREPPTPPCPLCQPLGTCLAAFPPPTRAFPSAPRDFARVAALNPQPCLCPRGTVLPISQG